MVIEKKFISQNIREYKLKQFVADQLSRVGLSDIKLQRTPLGDKVVIKVSRPGLVVGRRGSNIQKLTEALKSGFNLENPQIEIEEVKQYGLDASVMAEMIVNSLERFGSQRFKGVGHKAVMDVMKAGAQGVEIIISGKIPSMRAKSWRFYQGYMKKCGDVAVSGVDTAYDVAVLKSGVVGVKVMIMGPNTKLPDDITLLEEPIEPIVEELDKEESTKVEDEIKAETKKKVEDKKNSKSQKSDKKTKKKSTKKKVKKKTPKKVETKKSEKVEKIEKSDKSDQSGMVEQTKESKLESKSESKSETKSESKEETEKQEKKEQAIIEVEKTNKADKTGE